jgi:iron(III) transport system ATP-binding protein
MLRLQGITKNYGDQQGVRDVGLVAPAGSRTVIVGPSGSGKTTLMRLIAGFEAPDAGTITLGEQVLNAVPPHRRNIAYLAQEGALFPHMSVADNVGFALSRGTPDRRRRIDDLLARVGLTATFGTRRPHELSGGQQQRVALARALAQQPALMLLDEPFSALDTGLREAMRDMVELVLRQAGIASILVTHDQSEALAFADHLVVMRDGRVADAGPPRRLYEKPVDVATAQFLGEAIILSSSISNGRADTALGPIPVEHGDARAANLLLRPEQITVSKDPHKDIAMAGRIIHRTYRGAQWRLDIACTGLAQRLVVDVPAQLIFDVGDEVYLSLTGRGHVLT